MQVYITKTRLFKYIENFTTKNGKFSDKKKWYFVIFLLKHCGYSLEPPLTEAVLTSTHNLCFKQKSEKIMYTPVNPSFCYIKVGFKEVKFI